jgi:transcriptional regulator with XRE-family HTH domain
MPALDDTRLGRHREFDREVGGSVRWLRQQRGLRQEDLAALADMDPTQLSRVENGERSLKFREGIAIAHYLGIRAEALTRGLQ